MLDGLALASLGWVLDLLIAGLALYALRRRGRRPATRMATDPAAQPQDGAQRLHQAPYGGGYDASPGAHR